VLPLRYLNISHPLYDQFLNYLPRYEAYMLNIMYARDTTTPESAGANKWDVSTIAAVIIGVLALAAAVPGAVLAVKKLQKASTNRRER